MKYEIQKLYFDSVYFTNTKHISSIELFTEYRYIYMTQTQ